MHTSHGPELHPSELGFHNVPSFLSTLKLAQQTSLPVLLTGPTGAGKSTLARHIHDHSTRAAGPFQVISLASLHESTLESELFGHERGAFTGAERQKPGLLSMAEGGTVFLDEIGELSLPLQARLLDFLQTKTLRPIGALQSKKCNVRVLAATHRPLGDWVNQGKFREDLFYRLRVLHLELPSIDSATPEQRESFVLRIFKQVLKNVRQEIQESSAAGPSVPLGPQAAAALPSEVAKEVIALIVARPWRGNFRELRNLLEVSFLRCLARGKSRIESDDLPDWFWSSDEPENATKPKSAPEIAKISTGSSTIQVTVDERYQDSLDRFEKAYFSAIFRHNSATLKSVAMRLGISTSTLKRRLRALGVPVRDRTERSFF